MEQLSFRNQYVLVRHGKSHANEAGLIISTLEEGCKPEWGLTDIGRAQARDAGKKLGDMLKGLALDPVIFASPFARTMQTAELIAEQLGPHIPIQVATDLREREFGQLEGAADSNYAGEWAQDVVDASYKPGGTGESVQEVAARAWGLMQRLEQEFTDRCILLVSHGDTLTVLTARVQGPDLGSHRMYAVPNCGIIRIPS